MEYLRIEESHCRRSNHYRVGFHSVLVEEYLHYSIHKASLSRVTDCKSVKLNPSALKNVNEGRSIIQPLERWTNDHC